MSYAHAKRVIHRDLKPANIMVGRFGEVYVMDWGLARSLDLEDTRDLRLQNARPVADTHISSDRRDRAADTPHSPLLTMDGDVVGTPSYMPPEQARGRVGEIGAQSDVYAMGAMLYHLLTGRMPFVEPGDQLRPQTIVAMVAQGPPKPIHEIAPDVPPEVVAICDKAMARSLTDRYPDMAALAEDLRAYLENRVVAAYETGALAELKKWVVRNKGVTVTSTAALLLVAALTAIFVLRLDHERNVAVANENLARDNARVAQDERDRVLRLSDAKHVDDLLVEMDALWPAYPEKVAAMESWLVRARELLGRCRITRRPWRSWNSGFPQDRQLIRRLDPRPNSARTPSHGGGKRPSPRSWWNCARWPGTIRSDEPSLAWRDGSKWASEIAQRSIDSTAPNGTRRSRRSRTRWCVPCTRGSGSASSWDWFRSVPIRNRGSGSSGTFSPGRNRLGIDAGGS